MPELLVIPLLNHKVSLFSGPTFYFNDHLFIDRITDDEHSAFFRGAKDEYKNALDINTTKCIKHKAEVFDQDNAKLIKTKTLFCLNLFSDTPLVATWAGILLEGRKLKIKEIAEFEALAGLNKISSRKFKLHNDIKRIAVHDFYKVIEAALKASPEIIFTLEKYNSSILRTEFYDQLVDTTL